MALTGIPGTTETHVRRRRVYHIGGYDPAPPSAVFERFTRELRRFERAWGTHASTTELEVSGDLASWQVSASGSNWRTEIEMRLVRWDDVIVGSGVQPTWRRLVPAVIAFCDFLVAGAFTAYLRSSWRYALFFLYPILILALAGSVSAAAAAFILSSTGSYFAAILTLFISLYATLYAADRLLYLNILIEDWIFSHRYVRKGDSILNDRLQRIAEEIARNAPADQADEILIIGHSLGAVLAIDLIDRAMKIQLDQSGNTRRLAFFSVGASTLKIGLHRAASGFRAAIGRVSSNLDVLWVDYRARSDVMNFFGAEMLRDLKLRPASSPLVRNVSIRRMIAPGRYPRIRKNWYKMHCQFVRGNDRRAPYDYFMTACGPLPAECIARSERGAMDYFDTEGQLIDSGDFACDLKGGTARK